MVESLSSELLILKSSVSESRELDDFVLLFVFVLSKLTIWNSSSLLEREGKLESKVKPHVSSESLGKPEELVLRYCLIEEEDEDAKEEEEVDAMEEIGIKDLRDDTELAAVPLERVGKLLESVVIACGVMLILFGMDDAEEDLFEIAESETIEDDTESVAKKILEADLWEDVEDDDDEWTWDEPEETLRLIAKGVEVYWMKDYWWIKSDSRKI